MTSKRKIFGATDAKEVVPYIADDADSQQASPLTLAMLNVGLAIPEHDSIWLSYTDGNLTQVDYTLATVTQATLTLAYSAGNMISVVKS